MVIISKYVSWSCKTKRASLASCCKRLLFCCCNDHRCQCTETKYHSSTVSPSVSQQEVFSLLLFLFPVCSCHKYLDFLGFLGKTFTGQHFSLLNSAPSIISSALQWPRDHIACAPNSNQHLTCYLKKVISKVMVGEGRAARKVVT